MIKNYKMTAERKITNISNINVWDNLEKEFTINTNLKFVPKTIFLEAKMEFTEPIYKKINKANTTYQFINDRGDWFNIYITQITKDNIKFKFTDCKNTGTYAYIINFFAIS